MEVGLEEQGKRLSLSWRYRFRKTPSSVCISVDGRPSRRIKTALSKFSGVVWTWPQYRVKLLVWGKGAFGISKESSMWFPCPSFPLAQSKMNADCCFFKFPQSSVDENILCVFRVKRTFSNFAGVKWTGPTKTILLPKKVYITIDAVCLIDWLTGHPPPSSSSSSSPDTSGDTPALGKKESMIV